MEHGIVKDWQDMERVCNPSGNKSRALIRPLQVWQHVYSRDALNVAAEEHAVLLTGAPHVRCAVM
jgi:hypothetical protein